LRFSGKAVRKRGTANQSVGRKRRRVNSHPKENDEVGFGTLGSSGSQISPSPEGQERKGGSLTLKGDDIFSTDTTPAHSPPFGKFCVGEKKNESLNCFL
jgi:hypothetical protein